MATVKGQDAVQRYMASLPGALKNNVLRGAARAAANVVSDEAKLRLGDRQVELANGSKSLIADAVKVATSAKDGQIIAKIQVKGPGAYVGPWLEYGTDPHFISVDDSVREGMSVRKINDAAKKGSLVINGHFVGATIHHPGARPHPFLRPALDTKEAEAFAAAQAYIHRRVARGDIMTPDASDGDDT